RTALLDGETTVTPKIDVGPECPFQVQGSSSGGTPPLTPPTPPTPTPPTPPTTPAAQPQPTPPTPTPPPTTPTLTVTVNTSSVFGTAPSLAGMAPTSPALGYSVPAEVANVTGALTCTTTATALSNVGTYPISDCSGLADVGFSIVYDYAASTHHVVKA